MMDVKTYMQTVGRQAPPPPRPNAPADNNHNNRPCV